MWMREDGVCVLHQVKNLERDRAAALGLLDSISGCDVERECVPFRRGPCDGCFSADVCDVTAVKIQGATFCDKIAVFVCRACRSRLYTDNSLYAQELEEVVVPVYRQ